MRLRRIRVHNFKCFKDAELNLRDLETVTIIGANGAGKSTLVIDALTWCIYGRTALTDLRGYRQEDLVRTGTKECSVEVEFEVSGDTCIVRRTFSTSKKGSSLEIFVNKKRLDMKIRDAEHFLCERIGLDYEGFVNSTIVRQEEMKRLISEDPSKRKDIFISLFRLGIYEEALQKTKQKKAEAEEELSEIKNKLSGIETLIGQEREWRNKIGELDTRIKETERYRTETEQVLQSIEVMLPELEEKEKELAIKETESKGISESIRRNQEKLVAAATNLSQFEAEVDKTAQKAASTALLKKNYERILTMKDDYSEVLHEKEMLEQLKRMRVEQEQVETDRMEEEQESLLKEKELIINEAGKASLGITARDLVKKHEEGLDKLEDSAIRVGRVQREIEIERSANPHSKKLVDLKKSEIESRRKLSKQRAIVDETLNRLVAELPRLSATEARLATIEIRITENRKSILDKRERLEDGRLVLGNVEGKGLISLKDADALISSLDAKMTQLAGLGYDPRLLDRLKNELDEATVAKERLIGVNQKVASIKEIINSLADETNALGKDLLKLEEEIRSSAGIKEEYQKSKEKLSSLKNEYSDIAAKHEGLKKQREEIEANLRSLETYKTTAKELSKKQKASERDISYYKLLESIFHRDGIPSSILKRVVPRVASESSSILAELSNGRYDAVTIEESDDGKLNIWVKDGEEKYGVHRFSGGEKVRIALAVRLAISKVLSELPEAGKRLSRMKTLIIDEGDLGSLDGDGLNSTIEIINSLTKLFGLTILISHLDAVKGWVSGNYVTVQRGERGASSTIEYA